MIKRVRVRKVTAEDLRGLPLDSDGDRQVTMILDDAISLGENLRIFIRQELLPVRPAIYEELHRILARHDRVRPRP